MRVIVKFLTYRQLAGTSETELVLPEEAALCDLVDVLRVDYPGLFPSAERAVYLVNHRSAQPATALRDGDEVLMLQVLGGG